MATTSRTGLIRRIFDGLEHGSALTTAEVVEALIRREHHFGPAATDELARTKRTERSLRHLVDRGDLAIGAPRGNLPTWTHPDGSGAEETSAEETDVDEGEDVAVSRRPLPLMTRPARRQIPGAAPGVPEPVSAGNVAAAAFVVGSLVLGVLILAIGTLRQLW